MKRLLTLLLAICMILSICACSSDKDTGIDYEELYGTNNTLKKLADNQALVLGNGKTFANYKDTNTTVETLNYVTSETYTLYRSTYQSSSDYVYYNGYYYYWYTSSTYEDLVLGDRTVTSQYTYSYLDLDQDESIMVKTTAYTTTSFNFKGGWITKDMTFNIVLNGYFSSYDAVKTACPELAAKINPVSEKKYYVDTTVPNNVSSNSYTYNTYYYIEQR